LDYYHRFATQLAEVGFASDEQEFLTKMKKIKKQGYYFSNGEVDPNVSGLSVPIKFSSKEAPMTLTLLGSKNRFEFVDLQKLIAILQSNAALIEQKFMGLSDHNSV
jgi:DNA-binding IclR family transcriptional regulator